MVLEQYLSILKDYIPNEIWHWSSRGWRSTMGMTLKD